MNLYLSKYFSDCWTVRGSHQSFLALTLYSLSPEHLPFLQDGRLAMLLYPPQSQTPIP